MLSLCLLFVKFFFNFSILEYFSLFFIFIIFINHHLCVTYNHPLAQVSLVNLCLRVCLCCVCALLLLKMASLVTLSSTLPTLTMDSPWPGQILYIKVPFSTRNITTIHTNQFYNAAVVSISFTAFTTRNLNYTNYAMKIIMRSLTFCSLKNFAPCDVIEQNPSTTSLYG